ncbi:MAG TPA: phosphoenolpyruvate--protein phosphotransferase [Rubricoccaceae bacterium]|nr:phosphoenolpyruvate--protein phosphotransferase [Rubricoccaceae bacterium]
MEPPLPLPADRPDEAPAAPVARPECVVQGIGVAPGVAIGPALLYLTTDYSEAQSEVAEEAVEEEVERFEEAVRRSERELGKIVTVAHEKVGESSSRIFDAQLLVLRDHAFYDAVIRLIRKHKWSAGHAVNAVMERHMQTLEASGHPAMHDRAADFADIQNRVLRNLQQRKALSNIAAQHVVVADTLSAADLLLFSRRHVLGCVLDFGGPTSHIAIMARALGVPAVVSLHGLSQEVQPDDVVVVDGFSGRVILNPDERTLRYYRGKQDLYARLQADREELAPAPATTLDGHTITLQANIEFKEELPLLAEFGAEGVGLFRTEMLFLTQGRPLDEAQQYEVYREALRTTDPHPVTFRLIDLGGDKILPMAHREANPFLGWRGIRILLAKPDLLRPQLRAILRAATEGNARILLPMVSALDELVAFRAMFDEVCAELAADREVFRRDIPIGVMVEVPSVALQAARFAEVTDFFSIGTNDLTQYTLAVDRGNDLVADRYRELHPAVLGLVKLAVDGAHAAGKPVTLCGELGANPRATVLLVGLGLDGLSVSPSYLPLVKRVLRAMTYEEAVALAEQALAQPDADAVGRLLDEHLSGHNSDLAQLLRPQSASDTAP